MASINLNFSSQTEKRKINDYYFKDLTVPVKFTNNLYDIADSRDADAIKNVLKNLFSFKKGERILLPEFGNPFYDVLYESMTPDFKTKVINIVTKAIQDWEPRITILNVNVNTNPDKNEVYVEIIYRFKYKNIIGNYNIAIT